MLTWSTTGSISFRTGQRIEFCTGFRTEHRRSYYWSWRARRSGLHISSWHDKYTQQYTVKEKCGRKIVKVLQLNQLSKPNNVIKMNFWNDEYWKSGHKIELAICARKFLFSLENLLKLNFRYDLMVGVVRSEAFFSLTSDDVQYGIEADRRMKILREFVRNTYTYHQPEILATIINEYTDWEKPVQHPVNIR